MEWRNDHYVCSLCGARLEISEFVLPAIFLDGSEGAREYRVLMLRGEEIHRCPVRSSGTDTETKSVP